MRSLVVCLCVVLTMLTGTQPSYAHSSLAVASPGVSAVVFTSPAQIRLTFDEDLISMGGSNQIVVKAPNGSVISKAKTYVTGSVAAVFLAKLKVFGKYRVTYRIVSADGHIVSSSYSFYYQRKTN